MPKRTAPSGVPAKQRRVRRRVTKPEEDYTDLARSLVLSSWEGIIQGLIDKAIEGGYQQTKLLLELGQISTADTKQITEKEKQQLCDALLSGLQLSLQRVDDCVDRQPPAEQKPISQDDNEKHTQF